METVTKQEIHTATIIHFIEKYRELEQKPLQEGYSLIKYLFKDKPYIAAHLCDHWHNKKREFGAFYLNLDYPSQLRFLNYWGINSDKDEHFLKEYYSSDFAPFFIKPTPILNVLRGVVLFFCNHGIVEQVYDIVLPNIPSRIDRFGNATNWGRFILLLPTHEQKNLLEKIAAYYEKKEGEGL